MNQHVRNLYVVVHNNRVEHASTGLAEFHRYISGVIKGVKSLSYYQKKFSNFDIIEHVDNLDKKYIFQKVK
ncbi:MAG: hypothetical protein Mars2KO_21610 [Maribacter sp.]